MGYRYLFLDLDGTLLDSVEAKNQSICRVLEMFGIPKGFASKQVSESIAKPRSIRLTEIWEDYFGKPIIKDTLSSMLMELSLDLQAHRFEPIKGAEILLKNERQKFQNYIITTAVGTEVSAILKYLNWTFESENIFSDVVDKGALFKFLINRDNLNPDKVLAVGDTASDLLAANKAGIDFWMITNACTQYEEFSSRIIGSSADINGLVDFLSGSIGEV